jgi:hypothetical protein
MNRKVFAAALVVILTVSISLGIILYSQNQQTQQKSLYTVTGTLTYAPGHAIFPGISSTTVTPALSSSPNAITFSEPDGHGGTINHTVDAFLYVNFVGQFSFPPNSPAGIGFPTGFTEGDLVKLSGNITYETTYQAYVMNATRITHDTS